MANRREELFQQLLNLPNPIEIREREKSEEWLDYGVLQLTEADAPHLLAWMAGEELVFADGESPELWVPLHCWRALAQQLPSPDWLRPMLDLLAMDMDNDWLGSDLFHIPAMLGEETLPVLAAYLGNAEEGLNDDGIASHLIETVAALGKAMPTLKADCAKLLEGHLRRFAVNDQYINGFLVSGLLEAGSSDNHELIRQAYESGYVNASICGDLEDVEIKLGLKAERSTPKPNYFEEFLKNSKSQCGNKLPQMIKDWADGGDYPVSAPIVHVPKIGRNDPCPCGSGKKYKKCCLQ